MPFSKLKNRKVMLCDMIYQKASKKTEWKDYLTVVYRDMVTDRKEKMIIEEPEMNIFFVKPEHRNFKKARHFLPVDQLDMKTVKCKNVIKEIAKEAGSQYEEYYKTHSSYNEKKQIFKYPYCLGADIDIETYFRTLWNEQCGNTDRKNPDKIFLDIEVDQIDYEGNIARHGECPINAVTIVDSRDRTSYTFLYDNGNNPQIKNFVNNQADFQSLLHKSFDESYPNIDYKIYMFTDELEMIIQIFNLIHKLARDFCMIWNMGFDIPYMIERIRVLGGDPSSIMCADDFPTDTLYYYEDTRSFEFSQKKDFFSISDMTHYTDGLINYASLRKSQGAVKRVNLGAVAKKELRDDKLDYSDSGNIRTLPYENYVKFVLYNIKDVLLLLGLDEKTHDIDNIYNMSLNNCVSYKDVLKQTITFRGLMYSYLRKIGFVLGHNVNFDANSHGKYDENGEKIDDDDDDETFQGAINADPTLNKKNGLFLYGTPSKFLYGLVIDFDFSAMYPNSITAFNIFATSLLGKVIIEYKPLHTYDEDMGKEYIEDLIAGDHIFMGEKWHNLPSFEKINEKIKDKYGV